MFKKNLIYFESLFIICIISFTVLFLPVEYLFRNTLLFILLCGIIILSFSTISILFNFNLGISSLLRLLKLVKEKSPIYLVEYVSKLFGIFSFKIIILLNNLFKHPYTKIEFIENDLGVSRITASKYLNQLAKDKVLKKEKLGTGNYYVNEKLIKILTLKD